MAGESVRQCGRIERVLDVAKARGMRSGENLVGDAVERAYRRRDALETRRALMDAWAAYRASDGAKVVTFAKRQR
jgi:hypothetical protein